MSEKKDEYPYAAIFISIYHNDIWTDTYEFDIDGADNLDTVIAALVRKTQLDQDTRDKTRLTK
jgi:hypothetical protein